MDYTLHMRMNERLFLRDPDSSDLGRRIVREGILLLDEAGLEETTFRKLADRLGTKEASIYRYFENKHRLLIYLVAWYWQWLEYEVIFQTHNLTDPRQKLVLMLRVLLGPTQPPDSTPAPGPTDAPIPGRIDVQALHRIVIREASKAYLTRHVTDDNRQQLFKPYKDLCARIAGLIRDYRPDYPYARSRASSLIETAHSQAFFMQYLPSLTDFSGADASESLAAYLQHLLFSSLDQPEIGLSVQPGRITDDGWSIFSKY
jgi:AcrR family transcriptional regulator